MSRSLSFWDTIPAKAGTYSSTFEKLTNGPRPAPGWCL